MIHKTVRTLDAGSVFYKRAGLIIWGIMTIAFSVGARFEGLAAVEASKRSISVIGGGGGRAA